jgi:hypothetical protein
MFYRTFIVGLLATLAVLATGCTSDTAKMTRNRELAPAYEPPPRPQGGCCQGGCCR